LRNQFYNYFIEKGIILRPIGNVIYILPSYIISEESLQQIYTTIEQALNEIPC
jgi:adenosylmethionine-8-amino-7-oxononanoate aminotransferase